MAPPQLDLAGELGRLLSGADVALYRLDELARSLPGADPFIRVEAAASCQIGSLENVDTSKVEHCAAAMSYGLSRLREMPVSVSLLREIHAKLFGADHGLPFTPGELRTVPGWIGRVDSTLETAIYVAPPPDAIPRALDDFEKALRADSGLPLLIEIGLAHAEFLRIHPFADGNGRVARILTQLLLCESGLICKPALYLSRYFEQHGPAYYAALQATHEGDWETWTAFFLYGVAEASAQAVEAVRFMPGTWVQRARGTDRFVAGAYNGH